MTQSLEQHANFLDNFITNPPRLSAFRQADVALRFSFGYWCAHVQTFRRSLLAEQSDNLPGEPPKAATVNLNPGSDVLFVPFHPINRRLSTFDLSRKTIRYTSGQYKVYYIDIEGSFSDYLAKLSPKSRHELRRTVRKFIRSCEDSNYFREYRSASEMSDFHKLACKISKQTALGKWGNNGIAPTLQFCSELENSAERGMVRGFVLFHQGRPVAFDLCRLRGNCLSGDFRGYDPAFRQFSPGRVLTFSILNRLFDEGTVERYDFGPGAADYKAVFSKTNVRCADIYYFRRNMKNGCLIMAHFGFRVLCKCFTKMVGLRHASKLVRKLIKGLLIRPAISR